MNRSDSQSLLKNELFHKRHTKKLSRLSKSEKTVSFNRDEIDSSVGFFVSTHEKQSILEKKNTKKDKSNASFVKSNSKFKINKIESSEGSSENCDKNKFDKKKWRVQKYSKEYKLQQWEERRKKKLLHQYQKQVKNEITGFDVQKIYEQYQNEDEIHQKPLKSTDEEISDETVHYNSEKIPLTEKEIEALKEERRKIKLEKYRKLSKKTKKGQPMMKYRMEMLLEQIEKSIN